MSPGPRAHAWSRPCAYDPDPDEYEATARFPNIRSPLLVAFPGLLAPKVLQWRSTSDTFHFSFAVHAQLLGNSELLASRCCRSIALQDIPRRSLQKWQAWLSGRTVSKYSRRGWFQRGRPACASNGATKIIRASIGGSYALIISKESFRPVNHLRVAGCAARSAIAKDIAL